jgi:hypothetical protein
MKPAVRPLFNQALAFEIKKCLCEGLNIKPQEVGNSTACKRVIDNGFIPTFVHILSRDGNEESSDALDRRRRILIENGCFAPFEVSVDCVCLLLPKSRIALRQGTEFLLVEAGQQAAHNHGCAVAVLLETTEPHKIAWAGNLNRVIWSSHTFLINRNGTLLHSVDVSSGGAFLIQTAARRHIAQPSLWSGIGTDDVQLSGHSARRWSKNIRNHLALPTQTMEFLLLFADLIRRLAYIYDYELVFIKTDFCIASNAPKLTLFIFK